MYRFAFPFIVFLFCVYAFGDDILRIPALNDAISQYYKTVDKAKQSYKSELQKELESVQRQGDIAAYNEIEAEIKYTEGNNGHSVSEYKPQSRSLESAKITLKRNVETAQSNFKKAAKKVASDLLKAGKIDEARDVDSMTKRVEPPRVEDTPVSPAAPNPPLQPVPNIDKTVKEILLKEIPLDSSSAIPEYGTYTSKYQVFSSSILAHAPSKFVYRLDKKWKTFLTSYGLEKDTDLGKANCIFIVKGDGKELFRSGEIRQDYPRPLELDVSDVDQLELIVDPNGDKNEDRAVWFLPSLSRQDFVVPQEIQKIYDQITEETTFDQVEKLLNRESTASQTKMRDSVMFYRHFSHQIDRWNINISFKQLYDDLNDRDIQEQKNPKNYGLTNKSISFWYEIQNPQGGMIRSHSINRVGFNPKPKEITEIQERLWNIPVAKIKRKLSSQPGSWTEFGRFTPDGKKFIAVSWSESAYNVFDVETGKVTAKVRSIHNFSDFDVHPSGKFAASMTKDGKPSKIIFWNISDGSRFKEIDTPVNADPVSFNADGSLMAFIGENNSVVVLNVDSGKELHRFVGHTEYVQRLKFTPDSKFIVSTGINGQAFLWSLETGKQTLDLTNPKAGEVLGLAINHAGNILAIRGDNGNIVLLRDIKTGKILKRIEGFPDGIACLDFSPDDSKLIIGARIAQYSSVWDIQTGLPLYRLPSRWGWDRAAIFSPDGKTIVTSSKDPITIWEVPTQADLEQWERELKNEQDTAKEILLIKMPLKTFNADYLYDWMQYDTYPSERKDFENSIWAHASSRYVYQLDKKWKTFKTSYGIRFGAVLYDDNAKCIFIVKGDGKELFRSEVIHDCTDRPLELDVRNIEKLELIVDPNGSNAYDHGIWFTPMLYR